MGFAGFSRDCLYHERGVVNAMMNKQQMLADIEERQRAMREEIAARKAMRELGLIDDHDWQLPPQPEPPQPEPQQPLIYRRFQSQQASAQPEPSPLIVLDDEGSEVDLVKEFDVLMKVVNQLVDQTDAMRERMQTFERAGRRLEAELKALRERSTQLTINVDGREARLSGEVRKLDLAVPLSVPASLRKGRADAA